MWDDDVTMTGSHISVSEMGQSKKAGGSAGTAGTAGAGAAAASFHQKLVAQDLMLVDLQQVVILEVVMVVLLLVVVEAVDAQHQTDKPQGLVVLEL